MVVKRRVHPIPVFRRLQSSSSVDSSESSLHRIASTNTTPSVTPESISPGYWYARDSLPDDHEEEKNKRRRYSFFFQNDILNFHVSKQCFRRFGVFAVTPCCCCCLAGVALGAILIAALAATIALLGMYLQAIFPV